MGSGDRSASPIGKQHRQAIRHHDGASDTGLCSHTRVGHRAVGGLRRQMSHLGAVDLLQENRFDADGRLKLPSIGRYGSRMVAHMVAEIEAVIRCPAYTASTRGEYRARMGRCWPVGDEPVRVQNRGILMDGRL